MYIALKTIIISDIFGRDNQYFKGHEYSLTYSDWVIEKNSQGRSVTAFYSHKIHSDEDIEKYFRYEPDEIIRGG